MLYLPPHYAHDGVAERRLPDLFDRLPLAVLPGTGRSLPAVHGRLHRPAGPLCRPGPGAVEQAGRDPASTCWRRIAEELNKVRFTEDDVTIFLGEYLSEPKHNVFFTRPGQAADRWAASSTAVDKRGVALSPQDADAVPRQACVHQRRIVRRRPRRQGRAGAAGQPARAGRRGAGRRLGRRAWKRSTPGTRTAGWNWAEIATMGRHGQRQAVTMGASTPGPDFGAQLRAPVARASASLQMFDPDFTVWPLGAGGRRRAPAPLPARRRTIELALHESGHIERECPRFLRLLHDFGHRIECRATPPGLQQLTDSFCIADGVHIVRRFHGDHMRGEAALRRPRRLRDQPRTLCHDCGWNPARPCHANITGL